MATEVDLLLLAAGYGTRLRPLTLRVPKALLPIYGVALLDAHLARLLGGTAEGVPIGRVVVNGHHLAAALRAHLDAHARRDRIDFSFEREILGTGGAIAQAGGLLASDPFVVLNADTLFPTPLSAALAFHRRHRFLATMVLMRSGIRPNVEVDGARVASILPDRCKPEAFTFTGCHVISRDLLRLLPRGIFHDIRDTYRDLASQRRLGAFVWDPAGGSPFLDIGTPEAYLEAHRICLGPAGEQLGLVPQEGGGIALAEGFGYADAAVRRGVGCRIVRSILLGDTRVGPGVTITDSIVGPGAEVRTDVRHELVTVDGTRPIGRSRA